MRATHPNKQASASGVRPPHSAKSTSSDAVRIKRVTLPRYEVEYKDRAVALENAQQILQTKALTFPGSITEPAGAQIVLNLSVSGQAFSVSLLFRVIMSHPNQTVLEWWARRQTDPAQLELWIESLENGAPSTSSTTAEESQQAPLDTQALEKIYDLCRRALSKNPFVVLDLHWSSMPGEILRAHGEMVETLMSYRSHPALTVRTRRLLAQASANLTSVMDHLGSPQGRRDARERFVPRQQRLHAIGLLKSQLEVARMRGNSREARAIAQLLNEISA